LQPSTRADRRWLLTIDAPTHEDPLGRVQTHRGLLGPDLDQTGGQFIQLDEPELGCQAIPGGGIVVSVKRSYWRFFEWPALVPGDSAAC
jgi:hypothetical protein